MVVLTAIWALIEWQDNGAFERFSNDGNPGDWEPWILYVALGLLPGDRRAKTHFDRPATEAEIDCGCRRLRGRLAEARKGVRGMRAESKAAGRVLTYVDAVPGRLYPLVATLVELAARGHRVAVRCGIDDVALRALGLEARPLRSEIERFAPDDWRARTRSAPSARGSRSSANGRRSSCAISSRRSKSSSPTFSSSTKAPGAAVAGGALGLPWAFSIVSPVPLLRDAPPFGLGLAPRRDKVGAARPDSERLTLGTLERVIASHLNLLRAELACRRWRRSRRSTWPRRRSSPAGAAEQFARRTGRQSSGSSAPASGAASRPTRRLEELRQPLVLVTCSTLFQNDRSLVEVACAAFAGELFTVVVTTADVDPAGLEPPANVRIERFQPHGPLLERAACRLSRRMGITQKALAHGVRGSCPVRARSTGGRPARRGRPSRCPAPRAEASAETAPGSRPSRDRPAPGRATHCRRVRRGRRCGGHVDGFEELLLERPRRASTEAPALLRS